MQLYLIFLSLLVTHWLWVSTAQAASASPALLQARKEAESRGYLFESSREEILAKAKKEGALRGLLGFDEAAIKALRDGFRKRHPYINTQFEELGSPEKFQRYLLELKAGRGSDWDIAHVLTEGQHEFAPYGEKIDLRTMAEQAVLQIHPKMINPESRNVIALSST